MKRNQRKKKTWIVLKSYPLFNEAMSAVHKLRTRHIRCFSNASKSLHNIYVHPGDIESAKQL